MPVFVVAKLFSKRAPIHVFRLPRDHRAYGTQLVVAELTGCLSDTRSNHFQAPKRGSGDSQRRSSQPVAGMRSIKTSTKAWSGAKTQSAHRRATIANGKMTI